MAVGLVIYSKARAFKATAKAKNSRPRGQSQGLRIPRPSRRKVKAMKFGLKEND